jgi:hypothetical protein
MQYGHRNVAVDIVICVFDDMPKHRDLCLHEALRIHYDGEKLKELNAAHKKAISRTILGS